MSRAVVLLACIVACTPAASPRAKATALSFHEHRVMDLAKGLPTDTARSMDEYSAHWKTIAQRPWTNVSDSGVGEDETLEATLENEREVVLRRGKTVLYRQVLAKERQRFKPDQLVTWKGHWVLEFDEDVIIDGESLKKKGGYAAVFDWMIVGGEPLFFFVKNGRTGISHRGEELAVSYEHVLHGGCCEMAGYNPQQPSWGVRFHARHGVTWFYVEAALAE